MIDLHTHLLPEWDDGAKDWIETISMVKTAEKDGIKKICLTPHFNRLTKNADDIGAFEDKIAEFMLWAKRFEVEFFRGAEVFIEDRIIDSLQNNNLTINNSSYVFVEFPMDSVMWGVQDLFYKIMLKGYIPIISHPERNLVFSRKPDLLFGLVRRGALAQVTASSILGEFGHEAKRAAKIFLKHNLVHIIASDAHDSKARPPLLKKAVDRTKKIIGEERALAMVNNIPQAVLDNEIIPEYGEPINPEKKKKRWVST